MIKDVIDELVDYIENCAYIEVLQALTNEENIPQKYDNTWSDAEEIDLWTIADDNSRDAIEEMAEKLGETPEQIKEYMSKITLEDIHKAFQDFRDAMVATKEDN